MGKLIVTTSITVSWNSSRFYNTFGSSNHALDFFETTIMGVHIADNHKKMFKPLDKGRYDHRNVTTSIL